MTVQTLPPRQAGGSIRLLLVGLGKRVVDVLLPAIAKARVPIRVTGICDPADETTARADHLADLDLLPPDVPVYRSLDVALDAGSYDVALVACPHSEHQKATLALAAAGVMVWKEKPFALNLDDALELADNASAGLRVLAHRPHGQLLRIASRLLPGWGRLLSYRIRISRQTSDYSGTWRASAARAGGGAICDLGYHAFDLLTRLAPSATSVYAATVTSPAHRTSVPVEESAHLTIGHEDGCTGSVYLSRCDDWAEEFDLIAETGRITISGDTARIQVTDPSGTAHTVQMSAEDDPWSRMIRHHTETWLDPQVTTADVAVGVRTTALIDAAYASVETAAPAPVACPSIVSSDLVSEGVAS